MNMLLYLIYINTQFLLRANYYKRRKMVWQNYKLFLTFTTIFLIHR